MNSHRRIGLIAISCLIGTLAGCGGGGGGGGGEPPPQPQPQPTATLSASPTTVDAGGSSTLTWSSANASSCTAGGGTFSGTKAISGSESVGPISATTTYTVTCSGASSSATVTVRPPNVSGRLLIGPTTQTDSDTNDTLRTAVRNDTLATAQVLPNPVILGGFATVANSGPDGPLKAGGDVDDLYRVSLAANQVIELSIASPDTADLDLGLYTPTGTLIDSSVGVGNTERLVVVTAGDYVVRILAFAGSSNYVLTIGQATGTNSLNLGSTLSSNFVAGEVLAKFIEPAAAKNNPAIGFSQKTQVALSHKLTLAETAPGQHSLLKLNADTATVASKLSHQEFSFANERDRIKYETLYAIKALVRDPQVKWAEPNYIAESNAVPNDPRYGDQRWHYELIRLPDAWNIATGNGTVIAAVLDSGALGHPDLQARFVPGFDFVSDPFTADDGDGRDGNPSDPGEPSAQGDRYTFHGTHVAGTIGAMGNDAAGVTGVNWNVRIMPLRGIGIHGGDNNDLVAGMLAAARLPNAAGFTPAQRADVINMSFGISRLSTCPQVYQDAINQMRAAGVIVVASAGNDSSEAALVPANAPSSCNGVISVTAVNRFDQRAYYSNGGAGADVAAPGGDQTGYVFSTHATRQGTSYFTSFEGMQGTSMAAPHVTGVIALMKSVNPALTPAQVDSLLAAGALTDDIGPAGPDSLGVGRINAFKAVTAAQSGTIPTRPGQLSVSPSTLNFGDATTTQIVTLSNSGTAPVQFNQASSDNWIRVAAERIDANGLGTFRITVDRSGLTPGVYAGSVEFTGSVGTPVRVNVQMQVTTAPVVSDAGQHYLLLIDPSSFETRYQAEVNARGSAVNFSFTGVVAGSYLLAAGTDADNDGLICDEGEACGEYPVFGEGTTIEVNPTATGLDVATGYSNTIRVTAVGRPSGSAASQAERGFRRLK